MDKVTIARLITILDAEQAEAGAGLDIDPDRYIEIAAGRAPTDQETAILLASPLAREALRVAARLMGAETGDAEAGEPIVMVPRLLAASGDEARDRPLELELQDPGDDRPWGRLTLRTGFGGDLAWLLSLELDPAAWGGDVEGIPITIAEPGPQGLVWLQGTTDATGRIMGHWTADRPDPRQRWNDPGIPRPTLRHR